MNVDKIVSVDRLVKGRFQVRCHTELFIANFIDMFHRTILSSCNGSRSFSMQTTVDRITMLLACEVVRRLGVVASQPDLLEGWPNPCLVCPRGPQHPDRLQLLPGSQPDRLWVVEELELPMEGRIWRHSNKLRI